MKRTDIKNILIIGSGPIIIGQAAEFDYSGTQACLSLKEEGYKVILINPNPATIMTDKEIADEVYMEPLESEFITKIIRREKIDAILPTLGGQVALNAVVKLYNENVISKYDVEILGTSIEAIKIAEDRELFRNLMNKLNLPTPPNTIVKTVKQALDFGEKIGYPIIVRPAYTMGGSGGGIAYNSKQMTQIVGNGLQMSLNTQCLLEKSISGYKEIEYEVMQDKNKTSIVVCNMENINPVGVHTGDSIVVAPSLTLNNYQYQMLRDVSLKILKELNIQGGCNVQLAMNPIDNSYYIIEINPRVSRSSALASKATGYPIAKISAKIAVGLNLNEIINPITKTTYASFEPSLDYVVVKFPRFPFDKFITSNNIISTQMQATGETMAIGTNFEEAFLKSFYSLEINEKSLFLPKFFNKTLEQNLNDMKITTSELVFDIIAALQKGATIKTIAQQTTIDPYFLNKLKHIVDIKNALCENIENIDVLKYAKRYGFGNIDIANCWNKTPNEIRNICLQNNIKKVYKQVDTCSAEFKSNTPYLYSTTGTTNESIVSNKDKIIILGSGPIRIGQGVEFDYSTVHAIKTVKQMGYESIIINNNPETVSTDFTLADKLYFEPLVLEYVLDIIEHEQPKGVLLQFGGQTAINLSRELKNHGINVMGTTIESIDISEDRDKFHELLKTLDILQPASFIGKTIDDVIKKAQKIGYPILLRPSYVIGGQAMRICANIEEISQYFADFGEINANQEILVDQYVSGLEFEVDVVCDNNNEIFIPGIMEHVDSTGIHSGDSTVIFPSISFDNQQKEKVTSICKKIAKSLNVNGLMNVQFILKDKKIYVLEINLRSSRTIPFISKVTNFNLAKIATKVVLGQSLKQQNIISGFNKKRYQRYFVKSPVFSFTKLNNVDIVLGPEMKSTGESIGIDKTIDKALYKSLLSANTKIMRTNKVLITVGAKYNKELINITQHLINAGYEIFATIGTQKVLKKSNIDSNVVFKLHNDIDKKEHIQNVILNQDIDFIINVPNISDINTINESEILKETALKNSVPVITSINLAHNIARLIDFWSLGVEKI